MQSKDAASLYPKATSTTDYSQIINDVDIQAVFIATPTATHLELAMKALEARKHIFLEKPGTGSGQDLEKLVTKADKLQVKLAVGYIFVHHPALKKIEELINTSDINHILFEWNKLGTFTDDPIIHFLCHEIAIANALGINGNLQIDSEQQINISIAGRDILLYEMFWNGRDVQIHFNRVSETKRKAVTIQLDDGRLYVWENDGLWYWDTETLVSIPLPKTTALEEEVRDFLNAIIEDRKPKTDGQFGLVVWKTLEDLMKS